MTRRHHPICLVCGVPVGPYVQRCPDCRRAHEAKRHTERRANVKHIMAARIESSKALREIDQAIKSKYGWWVYGPPPSGYAISAPGW